MRFFATAFFVTISYSTTIAQFTMSMSMGYGSYKMNGMKNYLEYIRTSSVVNSQITSSFPSFWSYELGAKWVNDKGVLSGINFTYGSSGGRLFYGDYSGTLSTDLLLSFQAYSTSLGIQKDIGSIFNIQFDLHPGLTSTKFIYDYNLLPSNGSSDVTITSRSHNFTLQPTCVLTGSWGFLGVNLFAGYNLAIATGAFKPIEENGMKLPSSNIGSLKADWSGLRVGGGLTFSFREKLINTATELDEFTLGIGLGLDYGGIGANILYYPQENVGLFAGVGYALAGVGFNSGIKLRGNNNRRFIPYLTAMYGYNAAIVVKNTKDFNALFYGPSLGIGFDSQHLKTDKGYWSFGLIIPIRGQEVNTYMNFLEGQGVVFRNTLLPVLLSAGYRINVK